MLKSLVEKLMFPLRDILTHREYDLCSFVNGSLNLIDGGFECHNRDLKYNVSL